ncbi:hypothetical protein EX273_07875 [Staphylococcus epidermidis]|nr:hypothetical protein [Staphylococcus epidermidis]NAM93503.1 hypothetical protein [Staphylococcus epidermidis]
MSGTSLIVSDIFSILPIDTYIVKLIPIQRNSTRNSTDKASWGWGPNIRKFNEKFYRQSKLGLNILIDLIQSCLFLIFCENQIKLYLQILVYFDMMNRNIKNNL